MKKVLIFILFTIFNSILGDDFNIGKNFKDCKKNCLNSKIEEQKCSFICALRFPNHK